jgi:hypothetical protein
MTYRSPDETPRFICIVCHQTVAATPGACSRCSDAPLQPIEGEVVDELRRRAARKVKKANPERRRNIFAAVAAAACAVAFMSALIGSGIYHEQRSHHVWGRSDLTFVIALLVWAVFFGIFFYLARWRQWFRAATAFDAAAADVPALLAFLDIK